MRIVTSKQFNLAAKPYVQTLAFFADDTQARHAYKRLLGMPAVTVLTLLNDESDAVDGVVFFEQHAKSVKLLLSIQRDNLNRHHVYQKLMRWFSQQRITDLVVQLTANYADQHYLLSHGFTKLGNNSYQKHFTYPVGLVLGGGGAHGAFETGVFDVLMEHNVVPNNIVGVSVGAIMGVSLLHLDSSQAHETWATLTTQKVYQTQKVGLTTLDFSITIADHLLRGNYFQKASLRKILEPVVAKELATPPLVKFALVATEYPKLRATVFDITPQTKNAELVDWILASSAFYPIVDPVEINGKKYIDGGYSDNVPIAVSARQGSKIIYAVSIMENSLMNAKVPADVEVHMIKPAWPLGPLLDFIPALSREYTRLGEIRTRQVLGEYAGYYYALTADTDFSWLGHKLISTLASEPVTATIAVAVQKPAVKLAFKLWLEQTAQQPLGDDDRQYGLAIIERLAKRLELDKFKLYTSAEFIDAIVAAGQTKHAELGLPTKTITTAQVLANPEIILLGVLYVLSKQAKKGIMKVIN
ncbi:MAG: patatin-like phospholipase family protein [Lactobacillaceae bacterium]|jgi:predicted acylesterase/phospholipase RssA|nr:patatin-like phospholipase family protein [Lactobacillaceae bacterium]